MKVQELIIEMMENLEQLEVSKLAILQNKKDLENEVMTEEIKQQLKAIEEEFAPDLERLDTLIANSSKAIKDRCVELGETVTGPTMRVTFNKGRASWDSKALEGYAHAHPEILAMKKTGKPYASLRTLK